MRYQRVRSGNVYIQRQFERLDGEKVIKQADPMAPQTEVPRESAKEGELNTKMSAEHVLWGSIIFICATP